jgi:LuxR family transcriptional regulator, activator of conjugal transfer of Ti plasmids
MKPEQGKLMMPGFQTFIDRLQHAAEKQALADAMSGLTDALGITKFAYLGFPRPSPHQPVLISTYPPEWTSYYFRRRYQDIDPVVTRTRSGLLPFLWDSLSPGADASGEQRRFFGEATEFGINCGLTVPIHDGRGGIAAITFASDGKLSELQETIDAQRHYLHLAAIYFHVHARQKLEATIEFDCPHLSPREIACLQWVARGKSTWDIGEILSISRRTVVFHLENAKRKLNSVSLPQAVAIALQNRLIEF